MNQLPPIAQGERRRSFSLMIAAALGQGAMLVLSALAVREAIGTVRSGDQILPLTTLGMIAGAGVGLATLRYAERVLAEHVAQSYVAQLREVLFLRFSKAPASWLSQQRTGSLSLRYVGDLTAIKNWVGVGVARTISAGIMLPLAFLVLLAIDVRLGLAAGMPIILALVVMLRLGPPLRDAQAEVRKRRSRLAAAMTERLQQATALRQAGRIGIEKRSLRLQSSEIISAAVHRVQLSAIIRAMPDAASGVAGATTIWVCLSYNVPIGETVAALLTLSMIVRPMRHIADIRDRHSAWLVANEKLRRALNMPQIGRLRREGRKPREGRAALMVRSVPLGESLISFKLPRGAIRMLEAKDSAKAAHLLRLLGGLEDQKTGYLRVLGRRAGELDPKAVLYLGAASPSLRGSLRRDMSIGTGRSIEDDEILSVLDTLDLQPLVARIGGLSGRIDEGRRNLSATEQRGILLARGLLAQPELALVDADEIGFGTHEIALLIAHLRNIGSAALIATRQGGAAVGDERSIRLDQVMSGYVSQRANSMKPPETDGITR